jgi:EAL domain-containing protein (putative c-di-GMP-specific phosphodiesterase class I)
VNSASIAPCGSPTIENRPVFGMDVVAEGVETAEQLSQLEALGCEFVQGVLFLEAGRRGRSGLNDCVTALPRIRSL